MPGSYTLALLVLMLSVTSCQQTDQQKKSRIENQQLASREMVGLMYGQNTETLTFGVPHMSDFIIKSCNLHTYWKQNNVYISSEFREGQNMRVIVYEDNYRIILDKNFYVTYGFKFTAERNKVYTLRFLDEGRISKLMAVQISKTSSVQSKLNSSQIKTYDTKLSSLLSELKILSTLSQFSIIMSENNLYGLHGSFEKYWWYLLGEALIIVGIVVVQVKIMRGLLQADSIV